MRWDDEVPLRVAIVGPAGAGKTTHTKLLQQTTRGDVLSFATPLKKVCREVYEDRMDDPEFARKALQHIGTEGFRKLDSNVWVRLLLKKVSPDRPCYVDDCRFYNEYVALEQMGFVFVRLVATPETLHARRPHMTAAQWAHETEIESASIPGDIVISSETPTDKTHETIKAYLQLVRPECWPVRKTA